MHTRGRRIFIRQTIMPFGVIVSLLMTGVMVPVCAEQSPIQSAVLDESKKKIAVFDFELIDQSAGDGVIAKDAIDTENLRLSTQKACSMLADSGRYSIIDTSGIIKEIVSAGGVQHCDGCEGPIAKRLGADLSLIGIITRINRTEYTLQILIRDSRTGAVVSNEFTGLRMGANYAWSRGVKWLMKNKIISVQHPD